jgi:beta-mannosidase
MKIIDLSGDWEFGMPDGTWYPGILPGCNYLDLIANKLVDDPFFEENEKEAASFARYDYRYRKIFYAENIVIDNDYTELVIGQIDLFAIVTLNGTIVAKTDNAFKVYRIDITNHIKHGDNEIEILFKNPLPYMRKMGKAFKAKSYGIGVIGKNMVRKPQYHFGWDWGPNLPPVGIRDMIQIQSYTHARFISLRADQIHADGHVMLRITSEIDCLQTSVPSLLSVSLTFPDGHIEKCIEKISSQTIISEFFIVNPVLWWPNGMGEQVLYTLRADLLSITSGNLNDNPSQTELLDTWNKEIGLRTVKLNTEADFWGHNFMFAVNGIPIFAKGANWIPSDSFVNRTTPEKLDFYIRNARDANMNMLRVWGGGYYESDYFYELCDRYGILIWQDLAFACSSYPLLDPGFKENIHSEIKDNVQRLRHHACIALWCGNNEVFFGRTLSGKSALTMAHDTFFYNELPAWIAEDDPSTPYWPGSPSSGSPEIRANDLRSGDTHLWQVWHGLQSISAFQKMPTRFCAEFGMESMPSMQAILSFTGETDLQPFSKAMRSHQKSPGGNEKMLWYILGEYKNPGSFEDFVYLSQLVQARAVDAGVRFWRRYKGQCNGALFWQYNDCWPVASWSSIDYLGKFKILQRHARHFFASRILSCAAHKSGVDIYLVNDSPQEISGTVQWDVEDFDGNIVSSGECASTTGGMSVVWIERLVYATILNGRSRRDTLMFLRLIDRDGKVIAVQTVFFVKEKKVRFKSPQFSTEFHTDNKMAYLTIHSNIPAVNVAVEIDAARDHLSDNYFNLRANESKTLSFPSELIDDVSELRREIKIYSLAEVLERCQGTIVSNTFHKLKIFLRKDILIYWMLFKLIGPFM